MKEKTVGKGTRKMNKTVWLGYGSTEMCGYLGYGSAEQNRYTKGQEQSRDEKKNLIS